MDIELCGCTCEVDLKLIDKAIDLFAQRWHKSCNAEAPWNFNWIEKDDRVIKKIVHLLKSTIDLVSGFVTKL